jgi:formaldehyde-activating enzyme
MSERIGIRVGEALVRGTTKPTAAEPEIVIGELDGPVGQAFANLLGDQVKGHTRVLALLNGDIAVKPATLMVSKVTVSNPKYTNILMGTVQAAIANGVLDAVREGTIPKDKANELAIIAAIWVTPAAADDPDLDHQDLFDTHRAAMLQAIRKAMKFEPSIDWLLENQDKIQHSYFKRGLAGEL